MLQQARLINLNSKVLIYFKKLPNHMTFCTVVGYIKIDIHTSLYHNIMQYGSGNYEIPRNYVSSPVPRVRPEATGIADKHRGSAMYTCLNHPPASTFGKQKGFCLANYFLKLLLPFG